MKHRKIGFLGLSLFLSLGTLHAQENGLNAYLDSLSKASPLITNAKARQTWQEQKTKLGLLPADPTVSYAYLTGPGGVGKSTELELVQSLDFPSVYFHKSKLSKQERRMIRVEYEQQERVIKKDLFQLLAERQKVGSYCRIYRQWSEDGERTLQAVERLFLSGTKDQLEVTATQRFAIHLKTLYEKQRVLLKQLDARIVWMVGLSADSSLVAFWTERAVSLAQTMTPFAYLAEQSVLVKLQAQKLELAKHQVALSRSGSWPHLNVGYKQTFGEGVTFRGGIMGISIPIFESRNQVKTAQKAVYSESSAYNNQKSESFLALKGLQEQWNDLLLQETRMKTFLAQHQTEQWLMKSFVSGRISVLDFIREREKCLEDQLNLTDIQAQKLNIIGSLFLWQ